MKHQGGGKILNFSRAGGLVHAKPQMLAYNCAKAGIDALTVTFARAGKPWGISVNAPGPGTIVTQANLDAMYPAPEEIRDHWVSLEQLIEAALFLATKVGGGVNGVVLPVQGKDL
jgi:NAD(P)-dependent dehydrogenase (short-subunit alcohol dehydrogenase family)